MQVGFLLLADHSESVNGKLYMVQDQKMADGRMLFEVMRDRGAYNS